jgi:uncharacterized membrane protein YdjX (TVP38/TMEM64 family)
VRWTILIVLLLAFILVPFFLFEESFNQFAADVAKGEGSRWVAAASIAALLAADVFLPIPSSIVSTAAGVLLGFWGGAAAVFAGMTLACFIGYFTGSRMSGWARRFVGPQGLARAEGVARRYGDWAFVLCRPVPVLAEASVILAGLVKASFGRFLALTTLANLGIAFGYAAIGAYSMRLDSFLSAFIGAMLVPGLALLFARLFTGKRGRTSMH